MTQTMMISGLNLSSLRLKLLLILGSSFFYAHAQSRPDFNQPPSVNLSIIDSLISSGDKSIALESLLALYDKAVTLDSIKETSVYSRRLGRLFLKDRDYENAEKYYSSFLNASEVLNDSSQIRRAHLYIGNTNLTRYNAKDDWGDSIDDLLVSKIKKHYNTIIDNYADVDGDEELFSSLYGNYSVMYSHLDDLDTAEKYAIKSVKANQRVGDSISISSSRINLALVYLYKKEYDVAIDVLKQNIDDLELLDSTDHEVIGHKAASNGNLSYAYEQLGMYRETHYHDEIRDELKEFLREQQQLEALNEIEAKYNADKVRQEEQLNTAREAAKKAAFQKWTLALGILLAGLGLTLYLVSRAAKLKRKNLQLSLAQKELEREQQISKLQSENQSRVLSATLDGREIERKEIAQALHDSVSSLLSSANLHLQVTKHKAKKEIEELDKAKDIIKEASVKIRDLSHELVSSVLLKFGLTYAIKDACEKYSNSQVAFNYNVDEELPRYDENFEVKVNNMVVECLNNILKHSNATQATIIMKDQNQQLHISIKDNGKGFDTNILDYKGGIGLGQIQARVKNLHGKLNITSAIGQGTHIEFWLPIQPR